LRWKEKISFGRITISISTLSSANKTHSPAKYFAGNLENYLAERARPRAGRNSQSGSVIIDIGLKSRLDV
jgi:hypothetical protein